MTDNCTLPCQLILFYLQTYKMLLLLYMKDPSLFPLDYYLPLDFSSFRPVNLISKGDSDSRQHAYHTCGAGSRSYYTLQIALGFLPYFVRLCQSFRAYADTKQTKHLFNALKYSLSLSLTALAVAHQAARSGGPSGEVWH